MAGESFDLRQVAQSLRDELDAFLAGTAEAPGMRTILKCAAEHMHVAEKDRTSCTQRQTICEHSCPEHKEVMSPAVWGALPKDLLQIVFARLPLAAISRLKCLSKEWKASIETAHSDFCQVCEAINPKSSFALVTTDGDQHGVFWVRVFDMKANRWHEFEFSSGDRYCVAATACDGGLVCLLSVSPKASRASHEYLPKPVFLTVWNLLTREKKKLPALKHLDGLYPTMVQLFVDPQTKHYKVGVANQNIYDSGMPTRAYIYDSQSRKWSKVEKSPRVIFGVAYSWPLVLTDSVAPLLCKFDFATAQLHKLKCKVEPWGRADVLSYAVMEDRLFVLHEFEGELDSPVYCISEYRADVSPGNDQSGTNWLFEKIHSGCPFENAPSCPSEFSMDLFAYKGFLLVCAQNDVVEDSPFHHQRLWLCSLSTGKWRDLPNLVKYKEISEDPDMECRENLMCEVRPWHILR